MWSQRAWERGLGPALLCLGACVQRRKRGHVSINRQVVVAWSIRAPQHMFCCNCYVHTHYITFPTYSIYNAFTFFQICKAGMESFLRYGLPIFLINDWYQLVFIVKSWTCDYCLSFKFGVCAVIVSATKEPKVWTRAVVFGSMLLPLLSPKSWISLFCEGSIISFICFTQRLLNNNGRPWVCSLDSHGWLCWAQYEWERIDSLNTKLNCIATKIIYETDPPLPPLNWCQ